MRTRRTGSSSATRRKPTNRVLWRNGRRTAAAPCSSWATCSTARWRKRTVAGTSTLPTPAERKSRRSPHRRLSNPPQPPTVTSMLRSAISTNSRRTTMRRWTNCWSVSPRWSRNLKAGKARHLLWMTKWLSWRSPMSWRQSTWAVITTSSQKPCRRQSRLPCGKPERTRQNP